MSQLLGQQQIRDTMKDGGQAGGLQPQDRWKIKSHAQLCHQVLLKVLLQFVSLTFACDANEFGTSATQNAYSKQLNKY
jgi:hypothetical protein